MRLSDITETTMDAVRNAGAYVSDLVVPTVRLGVTGLARSGKTVFITSLIANLVAGSRLPFLRPYAEGRILRAYLEPQPDDDVPRFDYEGHLAALMADEPTWPESTRSISQLRLTIEYEPTHFVRRTLGTTGRLHVDIIDYPGEWLIDLPLLDMDYAQWSQEATRLAGVSGRGHIAREWLAFAEKLDAATPQDEQVALEGARLFTAYLSAARASASGVSTIGPGRFLMPGDLAGSPALTFFPLPRASDVPAKGSLAAMLARRYEAYKESVVKPFFRNHFSRLDRQIVLVDVLSAVNGGVDALTDLERALDGVMRAYRPGANSWLSAILARRVDRLVIAATKADHLHHTSHERLEALLDRLVSQARQRADYRGAEVRSVALAALRATHEAEARMGSDVLPCIAGVPLAGETIDGERFDGKREAAIFPGDLPDDASRLLSGEASMAIQTVRFRPPRIARKLDGSPHVLPHIRLDRALDFLIGDKLR